MLTKRILIILVVGLALTLTAQVALGGGLRFPLAAPLGTGFTFQGYLEDGGGAVTATKSITFRLYDVLSGGSELGSQTVADVAVENGVFTVTLNGGGEFGSSAFDGDARWLQIEIDATILAPRQPITAAPYAIFSLSTGSLRGQPVDATTPTNGAVLKWSADTWSAGTDLNDTYTAGLGLDLGSNEFSVDTSQVQARVSSVCAAGSSIRIVSQGGAVTCETDDGLLLLRTVVVSPAGTAGENGTALRAALDAITASSSDPYLLKIEPGVYDIGSTHLTMKSYVDIEGSGRGVTVVTGTYSHSGTFSSIDDGLVRGAANAELRSLTIVNSSSAGNWAVGLYTNVAVRLTDVAVEVDGAPGGGNVGMYVAGSGVELNHSSVTAKISDNNTGLYVNGSGGIEIRNSSIEGSDNSISTTSGAVVEVASSKLSGAVGGSGFACIGAFSGSYTSLNSTCG